MSKTLIEVKDYHMREGKRRDPFSCPLMQALKEKCLVYGATQEGIDFRRPKRTIELPKEALDFLQRYDAGEFPSPFSFEIDIPEQYLKS